MKRTVLLLALIVLSTPGCTSLQRAGTWVCEREQTISAGITQGGEMLSGIVGPVATGGAWVVTTILDAACEAFNVIVNAPADLGEDAMKLNPFGGSDETKPPDPPGK